MTYVESKKLIKWIFYVYSILLLISFKIKKNLRFLIYVTLNYKFYQFHLLVNMYENYGYVDHDVVT